MMYLGGNHVMSLESRWRKKEALSIDNITLNTDHLHMVRVNKHFDAEWCQSQFGDNWIWFSRGYLDLYFLNMEDALVAKLRFGLTG